MTIRVMSLLVAVLAGGTGCSLVQRLTQGSSAASNDFRIEGAMLGPQPELTPAYPDGGLLATLVAGQPIHGALTMVGDPKTLASSVSVQLLWTAAPGITTPAQLEALSRQEGPEKALAPGGVWGVQLEERALAATVAAGKRVYAFPILGADFDRKDRDRQLLLQHLEEAAATRQRFQGLMVVTSSAFPNTIYRSTYPFVFDFTGGGSYLELNANVGFPPRTLSEPELEAAYLAVLRQGNTNWDYPTIHFTGKEWMIRRNPLGVILSRDSSVTYLAKDKRDGSCWIIEGGVTQDSTGPNAWSAPRRDSGGQSTRIPCSSYEKLKAANPPPAAASPATTVPAAPKGKKK